MDPVQGPPHLNVPLPDPSALAPQQPNRMEQALSLITPLFALGTALGGSPQAGGALLHGAHQTLQRQQQDAHQQQQEAQRLAIQQQQMAALEQQRQMQAAQQRQQAVTQLLTSAQTATKGITNKAQFDSMLDFYENIGQQSLGLRPNTVRSVVRYFAPDAKEKLASTLKAFVANPMNKGAIETGQNLPSFSVDTDGDGIAEKPLSFAEAAEYVKDVYPLAVGPNGGIMAAPKTTNPDKFDQALKIETDLFIAEKGHPPQEGKEQALVYDKANKRAKTPESPSAGLSGVGASDADAIADAIISGDQPPDLKGLYRMGPAVRASLAKRGYNLSTAQLDWTATQKHLATLNGQQQTRMRQAVDNAYHSLDVIEQLADQWKGGKYPLLNRGRLAAAKSGALGPEAQQIATALEAQIKDVTSELANVYMGGNSPTDHAMELASHNLQTEWSEGTLRKLIQQQRMNLQIRQNSMRNVGVAGASAGNPYVPPDQPDAGVEVWVRDATGKLVRKKGGG